MQEHIKNTAEKVRPLIEAQRDQIFTQLKEICSFHSVHSTPELAQEHASAAAWTKAALEAAGLEVNEYAAETGSPTYIGTKPAAEGAPTILLYSHYDVVPAGDAEKWTDDPTTLTERNGRWYARGAADCKGNLVMHLATLRAVEELGGTDLGLTVLVEGSEEQGGEELSNLIRTQPELFRSDVILIADSGNTAVGEPTLTTCLRGGAQITIKVDTLQAPAHSGMVGGAAPDAVAALMRTIDSLRDEHGRIQIDGVDTSTKWQGASYDPETFRKDAGILDGVAIMGTEDDNPADMLWARPAISITGFTSTPVDKAVNAVPATAEARLNLRVPAGMNTVETAMAVVRHLEQHVPWGANVEITTEDLNAPFATDVTGPAMQVFDACLAAAYGRTETVKVGSGGSIPLCAELLEVNPDAELALFGVEEPQCTIHSPDESVDPNEIRDIAVAEATFLLSYGK